MTNNGSLVLRAEEVARYRDEGLVVPSYRVPDVMLARMRELLDRFLADNPDVPRDQMFTPHLRRGVAQGTVGDEEWMEFARLEAILDMVAQCIGPDFLLWGTTIFGKPAGSGKTIPWHRDGEFWPIRPLANTTVWLALDDSTLENGCLRYIPGSHKMGRTGRHVPTDQREVLLELALDASEFDEAEARDLTLEAGQMAIFDVYMVHGSNANRSGHRRAAFIMRFMPTTSHYDHAWGAELAERIRPSDIGRRPLFLMRGVDRSGLNDFEIGHAEAR